MVDVEDPQDGEASKAVPLRLWFGGILEGPRSGPDLDATLENVTQRIRALQLGRAELELDGGRFSLLLSDEVLPGDRLAASTRDAFMEELQRIVDAATDPGRLESTLRCTEIHADHANETLFAIHEGRFEGFGRSRELTASDARGEIPGSAAQVLPSAFQGKKALGILVAVVLLLGLLAWQRGLVDRMFAGDAATLVVETAGLEGCLKLEIESRWGNYVVTIARGEDYPETTAERKVLLEQSVSPARLALVRAVVDGGRLFVRLEDEEGKVLEATEVDLRELLPSADAEIKAVLPGRIRAAAIRIALVSGKQS